MRWGLSRCCCGGKNPYFGTANNLVDRRNGGIWTSALSGSWQDISTTPDAGVWVAKAALSGNAVSRLNLETGAVETSWPVANCRSIVSMATCADGGIVLGGNFQAVLPNPPYYAIQKRTASGDLLWIIEVVVDGKNRGLQSICADQDDNLFANFAAATSPSGPPNYVGGAYSLDSDGTLRWFRELWTPASAGHSSQTYVSRDLLGFVWVTIPTAPESGTKVYKLDAVSGATQGTVAFPGTPWSLGNDVNGNLYVSVLHPTLGGSLKSFAPDGTLRWSQAVSNPGDVAVNRDGTIFVANRLSAIVSAFDTKGNSVPIAADATVSYRALDVAGGKIGAFGA